jgi:tetratricopeptide (TPR) repeat protein
MNASRLILSAWLLACLPVCHAQSQSERDSYRDARRALNQQRFDEAVAGFRALREQYPASVYLGDAYYWEAYGLERGGNLEEALRVLDTLARALPEAKAIDEARALRVQICGELARRGNGECAQDVWNAVGEPNAQDDSLQIAAVNALINMPPERAVPLAMRVLANRQQPIGVRKQALFIIADKGDDAGDAAAVRETLLRTALDDSDALEVRNQAVFWLSEVPGSETLDALTRVLDGAGGEDLAKQAIFAISQQDGAPARELLKSIAGDRGRSIELRKQALFWAADSGMSAAELTAIYRATEEPQLREHMIFLLSEHDDDGVESLIEIARSDADIEMRKKAVFWLGQSDDPRAEQLLLELLEP